MGKVASEQLFQLPDVRHVDFFSNLFSQFWVEIHFYDLFVPGVVESFQYRFVALELCMPGGEHALEPTDHRAVLSEELVEHIFFQDPGFVHHHVGIHFEVVGYPDEIENIFVNLKT